LLVVALLGLGVDASWAQSSEGAKMVDQAWVAAAKKGDVDAIAALYAADAVYFPPDTQELRGNAAIKKSYAEWFGAMTITDAKIDSTYQTAGDLSIGYGLATVTMQPKSGGAPQTFTVRVTAAAKKINGKWQYIADHASAPMTTPGGSH
jgi:uncharacterized protein (TIGR02246 family)